MELLNRSASLARTAAAYVVLLLMFAQITVVALRYVFSIGRPWAYDLLVFCFFISALLPALYVLIRNANVRVDVLYVLWAEKGRRRVDRLALLFLLFPMTAYAGWASLSLTIRSWAVLESSPTYGGMPGFFLLKSLLSLTFFVLAAAALILALRRTPYGPEKPDEP
jgi:TRAP-type mannitol/chloroaromatic compound transport system permease small subunit